MTDFYSVLKKSIESRGLNSAADRHAAYDQARRAMIRKLWSQDPPLSVDEISNRISFFDAAVERIEGDYSAMAAMAAQPAVSRMAAARSARTSRTVPVYEGYDEASDYAPAVGWAAPPVAAEPEDEARPAEEDVWRVQRPAYEADEEIVDEPAPRVAPEDYYEPPQYDPPQYEPRADPGHYEPPRFETRETRSVVRRSRGPSLTTPVADDGDYGDDDARDAPPMAAPARQAAKKARRKRKGVDPRVLLLSAVIALLAVVLVGLVVYLVSPSRSPKVAATASIAAAKDASRLADLAAGGAEGAAPAADVRQSFNVFDGRDPTVFESAPGNPVQLDSDQAGAFARVTSAVGSAGSRALIGPGLAQQLAGQTVRVTVTARSSRESGAGTFRFAYQSGVAISHWQSAGLTSSYSSVALTWRVPSQRTGDSGDFLLIEPGVPGDGTRADIKSITIDLLAS